ncbi:UDP-N-acetylmuramate--L-alanine ligase [Patescibacteria group bacterium]|nr:UDP-N-acetylmuramate--L-alanine ligase [Patescibacteria group bacterium]
MTIKQASKIHVVGISGIGTSAVAQWLLSLGKKVTGSDLRATDLSARIEKKGAEITFGDHKAENVPNDAEMIIFSPAIPANNPERVKAQENDLTELSYPQALAELSHNYYKIAVSGTHGKTTTTAMLANIFIQAGLDPTVVVGSIISDWRSNFRLGKGKYLIFEADEYAKSFMHYQPDSVIVLNIDNDHLDTYSDLEDIIATFKQFVKKLPDHGFCILNADNDNSISLASATQAQVKKYSLLKPDKIDWQQKGMSIEADLPNLGKATIPVVGEHNLSNTLAALTAAQALEVDNLAIKKGLETYQGTWRRFEIMGQMNNSTIISDYAHHPTEIAATIKAAKQAFPDQSIVIIYQPHQKRRTKLLFTEIVEALKLSDKIYVTDIYDVAGRDNENDSVTAQDIVKKIDQAEYITELNAGNEVIKSLLKEKNIIIFMGAGSIHKMALEIIGK